MAVCRLLAHDCHCHFNLILLGFACRSFCRFFFSFCFEPRQSMRYHHRHRQQHTIHRILSYSYFTVHMATTVIERSMHQEHPVRAQPSNRVNANINTYIMKWQELVFFRCEIEKLCTRPSSERTHRETRTHTGHPSILIIPQSRPLHVREPKTFANLKSSVARLNIKMR